LIFDGCGAKKACYARYFDLLRNSNLTVPMYADRFELLVLTASLASVSLSKNKFLDRLRLGDAAASPNLLVFIPQNPL